MATQDQEKMHKMPRVQKGDFVYLETDHAAPYQIGKIEELYMTAKGDVQARMKCFYRRKDLTPILIAFADNPTSDKKSCSHPGDPDDFESKVAEKLGEKEKHLLKHRELFKTNDEIKTFPAAHIRGRCSVNPLCEEPLLAILNKEDTFFYSLAIEYDTKKRKHFLVERNKKCTVGKKSQAEIPRLLQEGQSDERDLSQLEELVWSLDSCKLTDEQIDQFVVTAKSADAFSRDSTSTKHVAGTKSNNDTVQLHAMDTLHKHGYDLAKAASSLMPSSKPTQCRGPIDEWSTSDMARFKKAFHEKGKDFHAICQKSLPEKSVKNIVEYYYIWKKTDSYEKQTRVRDPGSRPKEMSIPTYNKPSLAQITNATTLSQTSCLGFNATHSIQWYNWGLGHRHCLLCVQCWVYWKKYGGFREPALVNKLFLIRIQKTTPNDILVCPIAGCNKKFRAKSLLARHLVSTHGVTTGSVSNQSTSCSMSSALRKRLAEKRTVCKLRQPCLGEVYKNLGWCYSDLSDTSLDSDSSADKSAGNTGKDSSEDVVPNSLI